MRSSRKLALLTTAIVTACLGAPMPAFAAEPTVTVLPFNEPFDVVATSKRVFVSGGIDSTKIVVTDTAGRITHTIKHLPGPTDLQLSNDRKTLYVALTEVHEVLAYDTKTLRQVARYSTGDAQCPMSLAYTGRFLWFGYGCEQERGNVGRIDLQHRPATVKIGLVSEVIFGAPLVASALRNSKVLLVSQAAMTPSPSWSYRVSSGGKLTLGSGNESADPGSNLGDAAVDPAGKTAYAASGAPYDVLSYSMADMTVRGSHTYATGPYPNSVDVSSDGTRIAGGAVAPYNPDVFVFNPDGTEVTHFELGGQEHELADSGLAWAPNGRKLYAVSNDGYLHQNPGQLHVLPVPAAA